MTASHIQVPGSAERLGSAHSNLLYLRTIAVNLAHRILRRRSRHTGQVNADYDTGEWLQQREGRFWQSASSLSGYVDKEWRSERIIAEMDGRLWKVPTPDYYAFRRGRLIELLSEFDFGAKTLFELGSGTGSNLFALATSDRWTELVGLELSPTGREVAEIVSRHFSVDNRIAVDQIDLLDAASPAFRRLQGAVAFTHYCLEQLPNDTEKVFRNLVSAGLRRAILIEPSFELLDRGKLADLASLTYVLRQDYQRSIIRTARKLETEGLIKIVAIRRLDFVSSHRNDPTLLVWDTL